MNTIYIEKMWKKEMIIKIKNNNTNKKEFYKWKVRRGPHTEVYIGHPTIVANTLLYYLIQNHNEEKSSDDNLITS